LTVALRPAGIFGPGDRQVMTGFYQVYERGQTHFQIGDNTNLFDWSYVGNVARAHLLAADKLSTPSPCAPLSTLEKLPSTADDVPPLNSAELEILTTILPPIDLNGHYRIPTCEARPLGPYVIRPPNADQIEAAFNDSSLTPSNRPVIRTRFDQLSEQSINRAKVKNPDVSPLQVAGQAFFITNGEPCYFWDFARIVWQHLDTHFPDHRKKRSVLALPKAVGMFAAAGSEWAAWLLGKEPTFTRFKVAFSCATRWHNIEKARRVLGYEPEVGLDEGIKKMVDWWYSEYNAGNHKVAH